MTIQQSLITKLQDKTATIGIIGLGYVGLPLSLRFVKVGFKVISLDIDPEFSRRINAGQSYIRHFSNEAVQRAVENGFTATTDFSRAGQCDTLVLCVPTPLEDNHEPDLSFIINTMESLLPHLRDGQLVSLESTTYPGTTEEKLRPRTESRGFTIGDDVFLVY